jgi:hypothetical protein
MANLMVMTPEEEAAGEKRWQEWLEDRPQVIKDLGARFKPWKLYRLNSTKHRVTVLSFFEDGTLTVNITGEYNLVSMERSVFGIQPDDLEECDLPRPDEIVGVYLTEKEQLLMVNRRRAEFGNPPLSMEEFRNYGKTGGHYGEGKDLEPVDRDVPPPKVP